MLSTRSNPINLGDSADIARYEAVIRTLAPFSTTGALFIIHTPSPAAPAMALAERIVARSGDWPRALLSCWLGEFDPRVRVLLHRHKIAVYPTPRRLARAFVKMREYQRSRLLLAETPESVGQLDSDSVDATRRALAAMATQPIDADFAARALCPLLLGTGDSRASVAADDVGPAMRIDVSRDALFGMVVGVTPETPFPTLHTFATEWAILPISTVLSGDLVARLPSAPAYGLASHRAFTRFLARLSDVIVAVPEIAKLRFACAYGPHGMHISDIDLALATTHDNVRAYRFAVRPYPAELESTLDWSGETITIRPIKPQDEAAHHTFLDSLSADDMRMRFLGAARTPGHSQLARLTQIDYDREMAFIATVLDADGQPSTLGVARAMADPDNDTAEFAVVVRSDRKGRRLGALLMRRLIDYCRTRGTRSLVGEVFSDNARMVKLARRLGFVATRSDEPGVLNLRLPLFDDDAPVPPARRS